MRSGVKQSGEEGTQIAEINKFNMYFLKEVKKSGNDVVSVTSSDEEVDDNSPGDTIEFTSGKKFSFNSTNNVIELIEEDKTIRISKDIESCSFTKQSANDKTIISVKIKPEGLSRQSIEFVLNSESHVYQNENDYIQLTTSN